MKLIYLWEKLVHMSLVKGTRMKIERCWTVIKLKIPSINHLVLRQPLCCSAELAPMNWSMKYDSCIVTSTEGKKEKVQTSGYPSMMFVQNHRP